MKEDKSIRQRPEAYPKLTETDQQLKNQDEFIQVQNNREDEQYPLKQDSETQERNTRSQEDFNDQGRGI